uniref:Protein kinase domain-containing protein n=1 Tax=Meloidogyne hapla TaxID=6305 RepID=A0A1I8BRZ3_MELHA
MKDHDNILIVKLIDFGLSYLLKQGHETINLERKFPGTKGYRAPEIFNMNNKRCTEHDPRERPSLSQVIEMLVLVLQTQ